MSDAVSRTIRDAEEPLAPFLQFMETYQRLMASPGDPGIADFCFGNPHEMPLAEITDALRRHITPQHEMSYW